MPHCKVLTTHVCLRLPGYFSPCCYWDKDGTAFSNDDDRTMVNEGFNTYFHGALHQDVIETMNIKGEWHQGCIKCKNIEDAGLPSMRVKVSEEPVENKISWMQINLSNFCNYACKMCDTRSSSTISKLVENNPELKKWFREPSYTTDTDFKKVFEDVDLSNLNYVDLIGGEPFVDPQTVKFFEFLDERNVIQNVKLNVHTNTSFFPVKLVKYLKKFKKLNVKFSVDVYNETIEYIRLGSNFDNIQNVINQWKSFANENKNVRLVLFATLGVLTLEKLKDTITAAENLNIEFDWEWIEHPAHMNRNALPEEYVKEIIDDYNKPYLNNYKFEQEKFDSLKAFIKDTDGLQGKYLKDYLPRLAKYIEGE